MLSGTLTQSGSFNFTVTATDANGSTGSQDYQVTIVCLSVTLTPATLPQGTVGTAYTATTLTPSSGAAPFVFNVAGLPSGLTPNATSTNLTISGTPTVTGTFNVQVTASDGYSCPISQSYTLVIGCPAIAVNPGTLSAGIAGAAYSAITFTQTRGIGTVTL